MMEPAPGCQECAHYKQLATAFQEAVRQQHRLISYILASTTTDEDRAAVKRALLQGPERDTNANPS